MGLSSGYGSVGSNEERFKILDRALELGSTFWDSSDVCKLDRKSDHLMWMGID
jgi:aryl-alcohol dehydrogenase-like predicted oxidoreductase